MCKQMLYFVDCPEASSNSDAASVEAVRFMNQYRAVHPVEHIQTENIRGQLLRSYMFRIVTSLSKSRIDLQILKYIGYEKSLIFGRTHCLSTSTPLLMDDSRILHIFCDGWSKAKQQKKGGEERRIV